MSGMEDQLGAILGDPEMMQKIQALAQSMGQSQSTGQPEKPERAVQTSPAGPGPGDLEMLKAFTGFARGAEIDQNQRALLKALSPYVSREKIVKLEKAMRSAKLAQQTSGLLESGALKKLTGG